MKRKNGFVQIAHVREGDEELGHAGEAARGLEQGAVFVEARGDEHEGEPIADAGAELDARVGGEGRRNGGPGEQVEDGADDGHHRPPAADMRPVKTAIATFNPSV